MLRYRSCRRLVVIATHLDEDISAAGGLIARLAEQDVPIDVLAVTDGDGATVGAKGATPPHELGRRRAHRSVSYRRLGAYQVRRHDLALRSNTIADAEADVVAALSEILGFDPDPVCGGARSLAARRTRGPRRSRTSRRGRLPRLPRPARGVSGDELELRGPARRPVGACTAAAAHPATAPAQAACDRSPRSACRLTARWLAIGRSSCSAGSTAERARPGGRRSAGLAALFTVEHDGEVDQCEHGDDSGDPADDR